MDRSARRMTEGEAPPRAPSWIRDKRLRLADLHDIKRVMRSRALHTVCEEARCPNRGECFERGTATFLLMGDVCTRACGFCDIANGRPLPLDPAEPLRVAGAVRQMGLKFAVVTSVDLDDLPDGGAAHFAATIRALRALSPPPGIEVLTPDFRGRLEAVRIVIEARPDVFNHNVETVPRLYPAARRGSKLERSLSVLSSAKQFDPEMTTKSGLMVGLGETEDEVLELLAGMREADIDIVTIGQYLRPSRESLPVVEYVHPDVFERYREAGEAMGFRHVFAGPFVRSSYRAEEFAASAGGQR